MKSLKANIHDTVMPRQGISNVGMQIECIMHGTVFATHKHFDKHQIIITFNIYNLTWGTSSIQSHVQKYMSNP